MGYHFSFLDILRELKFVSDNNQKNILKGFESQKRFLKEEENRRGTKPIFLMKNLFFVEKHHIKEIQGGQKSIILYWGNFRQFW